jgi:hypothetical protein
MEWTEARVARAKLVVSKLNCLSQAADILSEEFEELVTYDSLRSALKRNSKSYVYPKPAGVYTKNSDLLLIAMFGDLHIPEQDKPTWSAIKKWLIDNQPDEIHLTGDVGEFLSVSHHGGNWGSVLSTECDAIRAFIEELKELCPNAKIIFYEGNHETRYHRFIDTAVPSLAGTYSIPLGCKLKELGVEWVPENKQPLKRGSLKIIHGHQEARHGGELPKHHAMKMAEIYAEVGETVVYFHTHKSQRFSLAKFEGTAEAVGVGGTRTMQPKWLRGKQAGWVHEFAVAYISPDDETDLYTVRVKNGRFVWNGKIYTADK